MKNSIALLAFALCTAATAEVRADEAPAIAAPTKLPFIRHDPIHGADVRLTAVTDGDDTFWNLDAAVTVKLTDLVALYGAASAAAYSDAQEFGNLQVGTAVTLRAPTASSTAWATAHAGLVLPTGPSGLNVLAFLPGAQFDQPNEFAALAPVWTARAGASAGGHDGNLFGAVEADVSTQLNPDESTSFSQATILSLAAAVGYASGPISVSGGLTLVAFDGLGDSASGAQGTVGYRAGRVQWLAGVSSSLDDGARGEAIAIDLGMRAGF
ncbi:MAG: hypothetical protein K8W52_16220 [Deltaproteobacteria bacterium]|nr:hypothetical protein [Deltaproteobacteria bacterium]